MPNLTDTTTYDVLLAQLHAEGFRLGLPAHVGREAAGIDRAVLAAEACAACGHEGLDYVPLHRPGSRRYRVLARCPGCGAGLEL
jgi:hypothetical protein